VPCRVESQDERTAQPFALLAAWHTGKAGASERLVAHLAQDALADILRPPDAPPPTPTLLSSLLGRLMSSSGARAEAAPAQEPKRRGRAFPELCEWMGELLYVDDEIGGTWAAYESDLEGMLGHEIGLGSFQVRIALTCGCCSMHRYDTQV